jgi:hypothetical protein
MRALILGVVLAGCVAPAGCVSPATSEPSGSQDRGPRPVPRPSRTEAPERLVGIGDVHGDFNALRNALLVAELIDDDGAWIGGEAVVVQTGDQLDRGDDEQQILDYLEVLADQAWAAGGEVVVLNGNHETMNVELDLRYVTPGGFVDFAEFAPAEPDAQLQGYPEGERGRVAAFRPGGVYAQLLAGRNVTVQVGDTVFVHGGVLAAHAAAGLEAINADVQAWMRGDAPEPQWIDGDGPVWVRDYGDETGPAACADLEQSLATLGASRMVVGHTRHPVINSACDEQVWRVDVGMAAYYGGSPQVLEIRGDSVAVVD